MRSILNFPATLTVGLIVFTSAACAADRVVYQGASGPGAGKHLVFLTGDEEYRSEEGLPMLAEILAARHGFKCTVLFAVDDDGHINPDVRTSLAGSKALDSADAIVMALRFRAWTDEAMERFENAYLRGVPIVALRTSTHAFNFPKESRWAKYTWNSGGPWPGGFGKHVLGETWVAHWGRHNREATRGVTEPSAKTDPILRGVGEIFGDTDVYEVHPPADVKILVRGQVVAGMNRKDPPADYSKERKSDKREQGINDPMMPVAWTRLHTNETGRVNKVFCATMGSATDLASESLRRLIVNAVYWGLDLEIPDKANVRYMRDYRPTKFGFGGFQKGIKPADLAPGPSLRDEALRPRVPPSELPLRFVARERVALIGNSLAGRMNLFGHFEALLHARFPAMELVVRNFARPADEVGIRQRPADYTELDDPLQVFGADTFLCFFGFNESFAGPEGLEKFKRDYERFLDEYARNYLRGAGPPRFVLISPIAFESTGDPFLPDGTEENENLRRYTAAVAEVAGKRGLAVVDLFAPTLELFKAQGPFTINGAHLNQRGDREVSLLLDRALFGTPHPARVGSAPFETLRAAINDKSWMHRQDYRMVNGWYVYGSRRTWDTDTFPLEYKKIRDMVAVRDRRVWDIARGKPHSPAPDDSGTTELVVPGSRYRSAGRDYAEPPELRYPTPEEAISAMKVPEGFEVKLFASEREFPELANPVQLNFDNRGRLWVACMPTYPQWRPGDPRPNDRLLILEDTTGDGKADKRTVFYDQLHCPTGFEFWNGGVLVVSQPSLLFLKDTTGDDTADEVVHWLDGWATDDTHHTIGAFEWSHGGLLHMLEGVSMSTAVETPRGAFRRSRAPGAYVLDPRSQRLRHFVTPAYGNGWCYVFNGWGQGFCGDGTGGNQHWDSPLSGEQFGGRASLDPVFASEQRLRPALGSEFLYSRHFPAEARGQFTLGIVINMNGLPRFDIRDDGSGYRGNRLMRWSLDEEGKTTRVADDLIDSSDKTFRPGDPQIGPDGALWFLDWSNALIGHMQYSQRDPNRDKTHGRIYRLVNKNEPLLQPATQFGKSVPELLDQLKVYEHRTRYRARRELRDRPAREVLPAVKNWVAQLDRSDAQYDRLLCEALWVQQGHHAADPGLIAKVLRARTPDARAAAVRVLSDQRHYIPGAYALIEPMVRDEHPRARLEAVRALSFHPGLETVALALQAVDRPLDYWLNYTLESTLGALRPVWEPVLIAGETVGTSEKQFGFLVDYYERLKPGGLAARHLDVLLSGGASSAEQEGAYSALAAMKGKADNGRDVFNRICISCHKVGEEGTDFGPNLAGVGHRMNSRDLIESVINPNAKVHPDYVATNVQTGDGEAHTGFVSAETDATLTLRIAGGEDLDIRKSDIAHRETIHTSVMPEGLAQGISPSEFLDLMEFMRSLK